MRYWLILLLLMTTWCGAEIHRVPVDYPTIQDALNALADSDTVLVDLGVYVEALQAPTLSFVLKGNVDPDTGNYPRPIVNPSILPNPTTLTCLTIPSGSCAAVEDFVFRNGPEMFPRQPEDIGGVRNDSPDSEFRRCTFDSTFRGIHPNPGRLIEDCEFRRVSRHAINALHVRARGCSFSKVPGSGGSCIAVLRDSSLVEDCWFKEYTGTSLIQISGPGVMIRNCLFGAAPSLTNEGLYGFALTGCRIENNLFKDLEVQMAVGILTCTGAEGDTCFIRGNEFLRNTATALSGGGGFILHGEGPPETILVENNVFDSCVGGNVYDALELFDSLETIAVSHNRFAGGMESDAYTVSAGDLTGDLRNNLFCQTGKAVTAVGNLRTMDARWNWWGDSTGPYHSIWNQAGQGDTVVGNILFDPWHTDTLFFNDVPERPPQLPDGFQLEVFPNPFNAVAMLKMFVDQPGIYRVDAFNVLGQHVEKIWSGPLAVDKQVLWDASHLTSGIYFVRVWQTIGNRPKAVQKLVLMK